MHFPLRPSLLYSAGVLLGVTVSILSAAPAHADLTASFVSSSPAGGGLTTFVYNLTFSPNIAGATLNVGNFLTLYDVGPVTATVPLGLTFSQALTGPTGVGTSPPDSASVLNATFTYNGALGTTLTTQTTFANVQLTSSFSGTRNGFYTSQDNFPNGTVSVFGAVALPAAAVDTAAPEPGSLALLLPAVGSVVIALRRRKR